MNKIINGITYTYQTRHNPPLYARIIYEHCGHPVYPIVALVLKSDTYECPLSYTKDLKYSISEQGINEYDLTIISQYANYKKDDLVAVKYSKKDSEAVRYFSHVDKKGYPYCFNNGGTSFTTSETSYWQFVRKITEEEAREMLSKNEVNNE